MSSSSISVNAQANNLASSATNVASRNEGTVNKSSDVGVILRLPMENLTTIFSFLSVNNLFPTYRTCKLFASAISSPLVMKMQTRLAEDVVLATVQLVGPVSHYADPLILNAALHNPILGNMRHLHLEALNRIPLSHNQIFAMLEVIQASHTSLTGLRIQLPISDYNSFPSFSSDASSSASSQGATPSLLNNSPEQLYSQFLAKKPQRVAFKIPSCSDPLVADEYAVNRCDKCDTMFAVHPRIVYRSELDIASDFYCGECLARTEGLDYSELSYLHALPTHQYEHCWRSFAQSNCVSYLKYLRIDGPPSACDFLTLHLPASLEVLHLNVLDVVDSAPVQLLNRWTDRFPKDLPQRILRAPNLKRLILCELNSDLELVEPDFHRTLRIMTSLAAPDFDFLSQLSQLPQLELLQLPIFLTSWDLAASSASSEKPLVPIVRKMEKLFLTPQFAEPYLSLFQHFPDLTSLYVKSFFSKRGVDFPKLKVSASTAASLTELSLGLEMNEFSVQPMLEYYETIELPSLTSLTMEKHPPIISKPNAGMYSFGKLFQKCVPNVTELSLKHFRAMIDFGEDFRQLKHLRHLKNFYWKRSAAHNADTSLRDVFPSLVSLHVQDCDVTYEVEKETASCVAHLLQTIPHLQSVRWMAEPELDHDELAAYLVEHVSVSREIHTESDKSSDSDTVEASPTFFSFLD